jgi:hypothetical protein
MNIGEEQEPIELPMPVDPASIPVEQPVRTAPIQEPAVAPVPEKVGS